MSMKHEHEKLVAKVQHFYDLLRKKEEMYETDSLVINSLEIKRVCTIKANEYGNIAGNFIEVFRDFIYEDR